MNGITGWRFQGSHWVRAAWFAATLLAIVGGLALYQSISLTSDYQTFPPPGRLVDMGGYRLHLNCMGAATAGSPTVIFESGLGAGSLPWALVQPGVSARTRACSYDRAGYGWSDPAPSPRTAGQIVDELHSLLSTAVVQPPYILVGHSFGSIVIRLYAATYPDEISALVMLDPRHEDFFQRMPPEFLQVDQANLQYAQLLNITTPLGLTRVAGAGGALDSHTSYLDPLPADTRSAATATMFYNPRHWGTSLAERGVIEESFAQVRETILPPALPLRVLIGEYGADAWQPPGTVLPQSSRDLWMELQQEHAALSTEGEWVIIEESGHYIHLDQPDAVIEAIFAMLPSS